MGWGKFTVPVLASILILGAFTVGYSIDDAFAKGNGQPKVTICHVDQETGEEKTITISNKAVSKHLANHLGDHLGECVIAPAPFCGDGIIDGSEECDDGNQVDTDACTNACELPVCGDTITSPPEQCDDGNTTSGDGCDSSCMIETEPEPFCGDGQVDPGEQCDDGNNNDGDGCKQCEAATGTGSLLITICLCGTAGTVSPNVCIEEGTCTFVLANPICEPLCQDAFGTSHTGGNCSRSSPFCSAN